MEQERLDKLRLGQEYMDADLLTDLQLFDEFLEAKRPVITVLCTDNNTRIQMDKQVPIYSEVALNVCCTTDAIDDIKPKVIYADVLIVNTLALKIAPEGLYNILKNYSQLEKECYFILSGWESLPKSLDLCKKKIAQIDSEFSFARVVNSKSVYTKDIEGFYDINTVINGYVKDIINRYEHIHAAQGETIYKYLCGKIKEFRTGICAGLRKEQGMLLQIQQSILAKEKKYEITFSHATVGVSDAIDRFIRSLKCVDVDDVLYYIEKENACDAKVAYLENGKSAERSAKQFVCDKISEAMSKYVSEGEEVLKSKNDTQISEVVYDLNANLTRIKSCKFIPDYEISSIGQIIDNTSKLIKSANTYNKSLSVIFDGVKESLLAKIKAFQYEEYKKNILTGVLSSLTAKRNDTSEESDQEEKQDESFEESKGFGDAEENVLSHGAEIIKKSVQQSKDAEDEARWDMFRSETIHLLDYSKNMLSSILYEYSRVKKEEIEIQSSSIIREYFSNIVKALERITQNLTNSLNLFGGSL